MSPRGNRLSPGKLLLTKWTAVVPRDREKHFMVVRVVEPDRPGGAIELVELEAVMTRRTQILPWRQLADATQWRQGWV